ncbi:MAG: glycosyltransferase [Bacteroidota bacterium]
MIFLIGGFTILHVFFYCFLAYRWRYIPKPEEKGSSISFSVVIPVRNEEKTITNILECLECQNYPKNLFEVIVVDDFSEDATQEKVYQFASNSDVNIRVSKLTDKTKKGKKHALTEGVKKARFETIITTDADCQMGEKWLKSYADAFTHNLNMVAGPVAILGKNFFGRLQQVEFAGLIGFGAVTLQEENPSMCSGANLGFKKKAFEAVGGYRNNLFIPSGDDEFLLFNIMKQFPHSTSFLKSEDAVVYTQAHSRLSSFVNQRVRWTSKWKYNKNWKVRLSAILFFFDYLFFYVALISGFLGTIDLRIIVSIIVLRYTSLSLFVSPVNRFLKGKSSVLPLMIFQIIYPLHVLFMGMNSIFGSYTWKGRKY